MYHLSHIETVTCNTFNSLPHIPTTLKKKSFENIVGKAENAGNQYFLLFSTMFSAL